MIVIQSYLSFWVLTTSALKICNLMDKDDAKEAYLVDATIQHSTGVNVIFTEFYYCEKYGIQKSE